MTICDLTWIIHESSLQQMRGAAREAVVVHRERMQQSRCSEIGSPLVVKNADI